jgi:hypothetical protein
MCNKCFNGEDEWRRRPLATAPRQLPAAPDTTVVLLLSRANVPHTQACGALRKPRCASTGGAGALDLRLLISGCSGGALSRSAHAPLCLPAWVQVFDTFVNSFSKSTKKKRIVVRPGATLEQPTAPTQQPAVAAQPTESVQQQEP